MFSPERMSFVTIASSKVNLERTIDTLQTLKLLHIDDHDPTLGIPLGTPLKHAEKVSELLLDLNFIKTRITLNTATPKQVTLSDAEQAISDVKRQLNALVAELDGIQQKKKEYNKRMQALEFLRSVGIDDSSIIATQSIGYIAGITTQLPALKKALAGKECEFFHSHDKKQQHVLIVTQKKELENIRTALNSFITAIQLEITETNHVQKDHQNVHEHLTSLTRDEEKVKERIIGLGITFNDDLAGSERFLRLSIKKAEAPLRFAVGNHSFLASGWVPTKSMPRVQEAFKDIPNIYLHADHDVHNGPTLLDNPKAVKPFEFFLNLYTLPRLGEIDPTFLVFLSFPIFFGIMLGDIGYGLVLYTVFSVVRWQLPKMKGVCDIILLSSLFTMLFGVVFGEFFGAEEVLGVHLPLLLHRLHQINELIMVAVLFGVIHVNLGFAFAFINEYRHAGLKKALMAKGSWFLLEIGGVIALGPMLHLSIAPPELGIGMLVVSVIGLFLGEGVIGIIEIPGLVSSILSYIRLAAVGLASALLAMVVNEMAGGMFASGGLMAGIGIIVLIIGHTINMLLGLLDAFLQSLRLHYVEQFTKFYSGNGKPYNPFGR